MSPHEKNTHLLGQSFVFLLRNIRRYGGSFPPDFVPNSPRRLYVSIIHDIYPISFYVVLLKHFSKNDNIENDKRHTVTVYPHC